jgi:hypothetical protein
MYLDLERGEFMAERRPERRAEGGVHYVKWNKLTGEEKEKR